jgi:putative ABC transport system permease protein
MFKNVIVTAIRVAFKQKLTTLLNILGIALGIAVSIVLIVHIRYETSYDKHITGVDRVYRITNQIFGENPRHWATTSTPLFYEITEFFPEIEHAARLRPIGNLALSFERENGDVMHFEENYGFSADSTVFDVFGIEFISGDPLDFYEDMFSLIITESMAERYFGDEDPIGKQLQLEGSEFYLTVKGLIPDCPENSHMNYSFLIPLKTIQARMVENGMEDLYYSKGWAGLYNYIRLKENVSLASVIDRMDDFTYHYYAPVYEDSAEILATQLMHLQPVRDIHLRSHLEEEIQVNGNMTYVIVFLVSLIFILIVVGTNYVNLATSLALKRTKEIGIKKVNGSSSSMIRIQIMSEALITSFLGGLLAILLVDLLLPYYNQLAEINFGLSNIFSSSNLLIFIGITLGLGFLSGIYPSLFVTRFDPVLALKGFKDPTSKAHTIRKILLVFQFVVSVFMIFSTIGIYTQMRYFQDKNLGFNKENLVSFQATGTMANYRYNNPAAFKEELMALPSIKAVAYASNIPGERLSVESLEMSDRDPDSPMPPMRFIRVCQDYIETMGLELVNGPGFTSDNPQTSKFILSERAVEALELEVPVDKTGNSMFGGEGIIRGVIRDYHFASLHQPVEPVVLEYNMSDNMRGWPGTVLIRLYPGNVKEQLAGIEAAIRSMVPDAIINFIFVDDYLDTLYVSEIKMSKLFKGFTLFTILIACLGLFGITAYNAELRTKEVGIRKVMGASRASLIRSLSFKFMVFVFISVALALPLAFWFISSWMQNFTYRASLSVYAWILAVFLSISIAYLTIVYHAIRTANKNPADILKCE